MRPLWVRQALHKVNYSLPDLFHVSELWELYIWIPGWWGGGYHAKFFMRKLCLLYIILTVKVSLLYAVNWKRYPFPHYHWVVPENTHTPPSYRRFFKLIPHPFRNSILVSYFHSKNWAFETPLPLGISINLPWGGHGYMYFLELHITDLYICE